MTAQAFAQEFKPTLWHRLGFGHAYVAPWGEEDGDADAITGLCRDGLLATSMVTETHVQFDWKDRFRVLLSGRVHVVVRTRSERDPGKCDSRSAVRVKGLGWVR